MQSCKYPGAVEAEEGVLCTWQTLGVRCWCTVCDKTSLGVPCLVKTVKRYVFSSALDTTNIDMNLLL